ncbi:hypothetical protein SH139x_002776 [Planctomycetaceae bacterium SH139]
MLQRGQAWLASQLNQHASRPVIYQRGALSAYLQATIGTSEYEQDDGTGPIVRHQVRDYLINTDLLLNSVIQSLPLAGDKIIEQDGMIRYVYEVMGLGSSPPWRFSDPFRLTLRIHTKQIQTSTD